MLLGSLTTPTSKATRNEYGLDDRKMAAEFPNMALESQHEPPTENKERWRSADTARRALWRAPTGTTGMQNDIFATQREALAMTHN
jgi:hypothetical protein